MKIVFDTKLQTHIADLLWQAQTHDEVKSIFAVYGNEAQVVQQMIIAHALDQVNDTQMAQIVINSIKRGV